MKKLLLITILLGVGYANECEEWNEEQGTYFNCDCNEDTWQDYYNSEGHNMEGCWLRYADLTGASLNFANLAYANLSCANFSGADLNYAYIDFTIWDECGITDSNDDGYDDVSYDAGAESGDLNLDGINNVLDVVALIDIILD